MDQQEMLAVVVVTMGIAQYLTFVGGFVKAIAMGNWWRNPSIEETIQFLLLLFVWAIFAAMKEKVTKRALAFGMVLGTALTIAF